MSTRTRDFPTNKELAEGYPLRIAIIIPSTRGKNKRITTTRFNKRVREARDFYTKLFGGATINTATGSYTTRNGQVIQERVAVIEIYTTTSAWNRQDLKVKRWLLDKKKNWEQESMGFEFEEELITI